MEQKKASDFHPEVLKLFDQFVHGGIDRRGFLNDAKKYAIGGVSAAMLLDASRLVPDMKGRKEV